VTSYIKVLSSFNAIVSWDRTRLRKGTTAETQTLGPIGLARGQGRVSRKIRSTKIQKKKSNTETVYNPVTVYIFAEVGEKSFTTKDINANLVSAGNL
jgi:hypothetical protein